MLDQPDDIRPILNDVSADAPWDLVEAFSRFPRWKPADVNASCDMIVERLRRHGVPVTVHAPEVYLSIPFGASVEADGQSFRAKPPAYSASVPGGLTAALIYAPAIY